MFYMSSYLFTNFTKTLIFVSDIYTYAFSIHYSQNAIARWRHHLNKPQL